MNAETSSDRRAAHFVIDGDVVLLRPSFLASHWLSLRRHPAPSSVTAITAAIIAAAALSHAYFFVVATRVRVRRDQRVERLGCECSIVRYPSHPLSPSPSAEEGRQAARCIKNNVWRSGGSHSSSSSHECDPDRARNGVRGDGDRVR